METDPNRPGEDRVRLRDSGVAVWAIIGNLRALGQDFAKSAVRQTAHDFAIHPSDVEAAIAYYRANQEVIDARLSINAAAVA